MANVCFSESQTSEVSQDYSCWEGPTIFESWLAMGDAVLGDILSFVNMYNFILAERVWSLNISEFLLIICCHD